MGNSQQRPKKKEKGVAALLVVLTLFAAGAGLIYLDTFYGGGRLQAYFSGVFQTETRAEKEIDAKGKMTLDESSRSAFAVFGKQFLLSTKDGVKYFNEMGDRKWNDTFNMTVPQLISEGDYAAVGDMNGNTVRVYGQNGLLYGVQTEGGLMQFALNKNGYLSVISKKDTAYSIQIYNAGGTLLKGRVEESNGVFPLSSDVSDDNKSFAVSYMDTSDIEPIGRVLFFYISPEDSENYTDSIFAAALEKTGEVIPKIGFMQGGVLTAVTDASVYGISATGEEAWSYPLENRLQQVSLADKNYVVLALGDAIANKDGRKKGTICWLDNSGKESASYESGGDVEYMHVSALGVVLGSDKLYSGVKNSGRLVWTYRATADVRDIIPMEQLDQVLLVTKNQGVVTKMKGTQTVRSAPSQETESQPREGTQEEEAAGDDSEEGLDQTETEQGSTGRGE